MILLIVSILALFGAKFRNEKQTWEPSMIDQAFLAVFTSALQPCVQVFYAGASKEVDKKYILWCM